MTALPQFNISCPLMKSPESEVLLGAHSCFCDQVTLHNEMDPVGCSGVVCSCPVGSICWQQHALLIPEPLPLRDPHGLCPFQRLRAVCPEFSHPTGCGVILIQTENDVHLLVSTITTDQTGSHTSRLIHSLPARPLGSSG